MKTLDKSRPFGQVVGASDTTAYIQDDVAFDGNGEQILTAKEAQQEAEASATAVPHAALLSQSVDKVKAELHDLGLEVLKAVRDAEAAGAGRVTLLAAIDAEIASKDELGKQLG